MSTSREKAAQVIVSNTGALASVEPIGKKPARKARKAPARGAAKGAQPSTVEAFQVLASRGQMGAEVAAHVDYATLIELARDAFVEPDPTNPPAIIAGLAKGFPGLVAAVKMSTTTLRAIMNGVG